MKAGECQILPFLNGKKQFIIPIYQRAYSWTEEQCAQLWNDIVRASTDKSVSGHFVGSIVYIQHGLLRVADGAQLLVIDGQQRLTTISLLLIALAKIAKESEITSVSAEDIYESYLINKFMRDEQRYKLLLTQSDKETLIQLLEDVERAKTTMKGHRLVQNYMFFEERIRQAGIDLDALYLGISKLIIVDISLDKDHDNPQLIFESLNSTGMDLSQADLIRNYVLMGLEHEEQSKLYKQYWYPMEQSFRSTDGGYQFDRFMRDYLTFKQGTIPNIDKVYVHFKSFQRGKLATAMQEIVADIYRFATYFVNMAFLKEPDAEIKSALSDINTLKVDVAYPFLLEVYDDYVHQKLSISDFIAILKMIESYVFRRVVCGVPTNSMNKTFAALAREIDKEHYLESVQIAFLQKDSYRRFPRDDEFRAAFVVKDVYNFRSRNYMLRKLENHNRKELVNVESCTIEHIMPQNEHLSPEWQQELGPDWQEIHARYLHTIGNLTLTGYNSELSDHPFAEKRDKEESGFKDSPLHLNRGLGQLERWNKEAIEKRAATLANEAAKIWSIPHLLPEMTNKIGKLGQKVPLETVIGPIEHPLAGFVPSGFKIMQMSKGKYHLLREVADEWIYYGNGKVAWYAISWPNAGFWARDKEKKNEMPLGVDGLITYPTTITAAEQDMLTEEVGENIANGTNGKKTYTLEDYPGLKGPMRELFEQLRRRISNLDVTVREEYKRNYILYKAATNFAAIAPKKELHVYLDMKIAEIDDPKGLCKTFGNGNIDIVITSTDQLDDAMDLIRQSFARHWEESVMEVM